MPWSPPFTQPLSFNDITSHTVFSRGEIQRCRKKVIEICHFLDVQKEEFEDLQNLLLNAMASLASSEEASGEMEEISDYQMAVPEPQEEEEEEEEEHDDDDAPTDYMPSETLATDIKSTDYIAPADCVPSETLATDIKSNNASGTKNEIPDSWITTSWKN